MPHKEQHWILYLSVVKGNNNGRIGTSLWFYSPLAFVSLPAATVGRGEGGGCGIDYAKPFFSLIVFVSMRFMVFGLMERVVINDLKVILAVS